jgi:hypothetical protein
MSNPYEGDSTTSVPGIKGTNTTTGKESDEPQTVTVRSTVIETEPSRTAADLRTEFDSPTFVGASAASSIAISHFEEAYRARPPWDIDGPQPDLARLLDAGLIQGRVLDIAAARARTPSSSPAEESTSPASTRPPSRSPARRPKPADGDYRHVSSKAMRCNSPHWGRRSTQSPTAGCCTCSPTRRCSR